MQVQPETAGNTVKDVQLVLIGGRSSVPNILSILYQKPQVVVALCSHESHNDFPHFKQMVECALSNCCVKELSPVDAFEPEEIAVQCVKAFQCYPEANWICNITSATSIMSIVVYERAKELQKNCWYLNTSKARVITLVGSMLKDEINTKIFHLSVSKYVSAYYYLLGDGDGEERRELCEQDWLPFAQMLGKEPRLALHLKSVLQAIGNNKPKKGQPKGYTLTKLSQEAFDMLKKAEQFELVNKLNGTSHAVKFTLTSMQHSFLDGGWLEVYVWNEAKQIKSLDGCNLFDDCQWNHKVTISGVTRELDVALTYKAQLLIAECKTGDEVKDHDTLNGLGAVANHLGGKFVGKILISSLFTPEGADTELEQITDGTLRGKVKSHREFLQKADHHHIVVIMAEDLPRIGELLKEEAINPKYPRI